MESDKDLVRPGLWAKNVLPEVKRRLRAKVPVIPDYEVGKGPFYDVILSYLFHNGFESSANFLEHLFETERFWLGSKYISKDLLVELAETLKDVEKEEATVFDLVTLALSLHERSKPLSWISKKLFDYALKLSSKIRSDGGNAEAKVRYAYGKFLLNENDSGNASKVLEVAYDLTLGKPWYSFGPTRTLLSDINNLLFQGYIQEAEKLFKTDLQSATMLSKKALKHSLEANNKLAPSKAYLMRGRVEIESGNYESALQLLNLGIQHAHVIPIHEDICNITFMKAICLTKMKQFQRAMTCVRLLTDRATKLDMHQFVGKSLMRMAHIEIMRENFHEACLNSLKALQLFTTINDHNGIRKARCRSGYAFALEIFPLYLELLGHTATTDGEDYSKRLVLWKEKRVPFWSEEGKKYQLLTSHVESYDFYKAGTFSVVAGQLIYNTDEKKLGAHYVDSAVYEKISFSKRIMFIYREFLKGICFYV